MLRNVSLDTLLDMVGSAPYQRLGIDARVNGPANAVWVKGDNRTLSVVATLNLSPSGQPVPGEAPSSGLIEAHLYATRRRGRSAQIRAAHAFQPA